MKPEDENKQPGQDPQPANGEPSSDDAAMQQALQALRQLPPVQAPDIVRARAKHAFMRGRAGRSAESVEVDADRAAASTAREAAGRNAGPVASRPETPGAAPRRRDERQPNEQRVVSLNPRHSNRLATFAFAAVLVLMLLGYGAQSPQPWRLTAVSDPAGDLRSRPDLTVGSVLSPGRLDTPEIGEFELTLGTALRLRMAPCSGIILPHAPRRWNPDVMTISVVHGELFGSTGGNKLPAAIELVTDVLSARITGTTFAVFHLPDATCVCLLEGSVQITPRVGNAATIDVPVESKVFVFNDGRPHEIAPLDGMERSKLQMLRDRATQH